MLGLLLLVTRPLALCRRPGPGKHTACERVRARPALQGAAPRCARRARRCAGRQEPPALARSPAAGAADPSRLTRPCPRLPTQRARPASGPHPGPFVPALAAVGLLRMIHPALPPSAHRPPCSCQSTPGLALRPTLAWPTAVPRSELDPARAPCCRPAGPCPRRARTRTAPATTALAAGRARPCVACGRGTLSQGASCALWNLGGRLPEPSQTCLCHDFVIRGPSTAHTYR